MQQHMERVMTQVQQMNQEMTQRQVRQEFRQMGEQLESAGVQMQAMLRNANKIRQTSGEGDDVHARRFEQLQERMQNLVRELERTQQALQELALP